jgi:fructose-1,6-bisphosphatase/inositol monophosphatase family enzyme
MSSELLALLNQAADAVAEALEHHDDWSVVKGSASQYHHDLVADAAAVAVLDRAGLGVLSEESGVHHPERPVTVILDPVDGSTNASRGLPWWAVSLCALDSEGPLAAVVTGPATGLRFEAVRGEGACRNGKRIRPSATEQVEKALVGVNGYPRFDFGWAQYRSLGSAALDICSVASGALDGFVDCSSAALAPWDYMGGLLVCQESGAHVSDLHDRDLVVRQPGERRAFVAAGTPALMQRLRLVRLGA